MLPFDWTIHTNVYFGKDKLNKLSDLIQQYNNILLVYGKSSAKRNGLYDSIIEILKKGKKNVYELDGVESNPQLSLVCKGIELCKENKVEFVLAVGGGSVIDTAKAVAIGAQTQQDVWEMFLDISIEINSALPIGVVLTNFGSGSEVSDSAVITNDKTGIKRYAMSSCIVPSFAILDPAYPKTMSKKQVGCALIDAFSHSFERYFVDEAEQSFLDGVLIALMKEAVRLAQSYLSSNGDQGTIEQMMWLSSISHMGLTETGRAGDWGCHDLAHEIGQAFNLPHGEAIAIMIKAWLKYNLRTAKTPRLERLINELATGQEEFFEKFEELCSSFEVKTNIKLDDNTIMDLTRKTLYNREVAGGAYCPLTEKKIIEIYKEVVE